MRDLDYITRTKEWRNKNYSLWGAFSINGKRLNDAEVRHVITRALECGFKTPSEIPDNVALQWIGELYVNTPKDDKFAELYGELSNKDIKTT